MLSKNFITPSKKKEKLSVLNNFKNLPYGRFFIKIDNKNIDLIHYIDKDNNDIAVMEVNNYYNLDLNFKIDNINGIFDERKVPLNIANNYFEDNKIIYYCTYYYLLILGTYIGIYNFKNLKYFKIKGCS